MNETNPVGDGRTVTVRVAISIRRRGGRKLVIAPDGTNVTAAPVRRHIDNAMVKAIAQAFRWREMLENGTHATIAEIAAAEKVNASYVSRVMRLTLLAPDIVEAILGGRQPAEMTLAVMMRPFVVDWTEQRMSKYQEPKRRSYDDDNTFGDRASEGRPSHPSPSA